MEFDVKFIDRLLKNLADNKRVFTNESQFQFELALALQKEGYPVELEVLSCNKEVEDISRLSKKEIEKYYSDIVVNLGNNEYAVIELKYKLPQKVMMHKIDDLKFITFSQGAPDVGSYLFWKDVERLEKFNNNLHLNFDNSKKIIKKFAIILTSDNKYWEGNDKSLYRNFFPKDKVRFEGDINCLIKINNSSHKRVSGKTKKSDNIEIIEATMHNYKQFESFYYIDKDKNEKASCKPVVPIRLKGPYQCEWKDYLVTDAATFRYLIMEVKEKGDYNDKTTYNK